MIRHFSFVMMKRNSIRKTGAINRTIILMEKVRLWTIEKNIQFKADPRVL